MSAFCDETIQLLKDDRDHWQRRALAAEGELKRWYGAVNKSRPDLKPWITRSLERIFHVVRRRR